MKKEIIKPTLVEENSNNEEIVKDLVVAKQMSPIRLILRRFFRSKLSIIGLIMLVFLFAFAFLGPVIYNVWGELGKDASGLVQYQSITETVVLADGSSVEIIQISEIHQQYNIFADPSWAHLLGTDDQGRDVFTRLMYGGRISLTIGFVVVILETLIGILMGGISGYFGGWVDNLIMRLVDIFNCIPTLPILLIASAVIDGWATTNPEIFANPTTRIIFLMIIITIFSWSGTARMVRGQILSLREQEYMTATEVMGLPVTRKIFKHLIPNVMPQLIVSMTLGLGSVILYESTLSYLGLGVQLPKAAWGTMIATANNPDVLQYHVNMWLPAGIMIVIAVLAFNFVGDGLRDAMDPKAKR